MAHVYRRPHRPQNYQHRLQGRTFLAGAGGTTYFQTVTGSITPSGSLSTTSVFLQSLAGSMTPTGGIVRQIGKNVLGSITPTGSISKLTARTVTGSITPTGGISKQTQRRTVGSIAMAGVVSTSQALEAVVTGTMTLSGTIAGLIIAPPSISNAIAKIRGFYGRMMGR